MTKYGKHSDGGPPSWRLLPNSPPYLPSLPSLPLQVVEIGHIICREFFKLKTFQLRSFLFESYMPRTRIYSRDHIVFFSAAKQYGVILTCQRYTCLVLYICFHRYKAPLDDCSRLYWYERLYRASHTTDTD